MKTYRENKQWHVQVKAAVNVLKIGQNEDEDITIQGKIKDMLLNGNLQILLKNIMNLYRFEDRWD